MKRYNSITIAAIVILILTGCGRAEPTAMPASTPVPPADTDVSPTVTPAPPIPTPEEDMPTLPPDTSMPVDTAWDDRTIFQAGLIDVEQSLLDRLPGATVYHIDLEIPDDFVQLHGHEEVRYTNREAEPLDEVYFRLFPNVAGGTATVSAVEVDGQEVQPIYEFDDSAVRVPLPQALPPGEQIVINLDFEIQVTFDMGGNYGLFGYFDDVLVLDTFYPVIPVYDDEGWNVEVPPPNGDWPYFDASFYVVNVTAPADLTVVAAGIEVSREQVGDEQVLTIAAGPTRDFYLAASEKYEVVSTTVGETTVNSYAFAERMERAEFALQVAADALESFNARLGVYPYTEFDVLSTPMLALGIEYPGIVGISLRAYDPDATISGAPSQYMQEVAVAHEVGHQWFYNVVGNDQMDEPWVDESLTQYITGLYFLDVHGESGGEQYRRNMWYGYWSGVDQAEIPIGLTADAYAGNEYGPIVYGRGPIFVTALAKEMGQETFDAFLRDYYTSNQWGISTSETFRQLAEQHCECDLTVLFEEWVY
ncbi:MAG: hypothetical protein GY832_23365 [Chloroflexi bacterium]|nr:hypothetical protein [Chloroflexota bacterium]